VHRATSLPGLGRMPPAWAECFSRFPG